VNVDCAKILYQALQLGGTGNGNDPWLLRQQPSKSDLRASHLPARRKFTEHIDQRLVRLTRFPSEAREDGVAIVAACESRVLVDRPGEKALA